MISRSDIGLINQSKSATRPHMEYVGEFIDNSAVTLMVTPNHIGLYKIINLYSKSNTILWLGFREDLFYKIVSLRKTKDVRISLIK